MGASPESSLLPDRRILPGRVQLYGNLYTVKLDFERNTLRGFSPWLSIKRQPHGRDERGVLPILIPYLLFPGRLEGRPPFDSESGVAVRAESAVHGEVQPDFKFRLR